MGAAARGILARISPALWVAAGALALARTVSGGHLHDLGWILVTGMLGGTGTLTQVITGLDRRERVLLAEALAASQRDADGQEPQAQQRHLRAL